jgi:ATP:ADP antiporter, AAA family
VRPGDFRRGLPLAAYHFLVIACYMMGRVARDAIFLDHLAATRLPYADISAALLAGVVVALHIRLGNRTNLRTVQATSVAVVSLSFVALWWGLHVRNWSGLAPFLYVWIGICGPLLVAQVWTLANVVWNTREAKRLVAMVGSGGIAGGIAGGFLAQTLAHTWGTDAMLLTMAAVLLPCTWLIGVGLRQQPAAAGSGRGDETGEAQGIIQSLRLVRRSPHLRIIAVLICLASMTTTTVGWQLKAVAKDALQSKDALAAYLGALTGFTGLASLSVQLLVTTPLLRRFGVGVALLVLPLTLAGGSVAVAVWGSLWAVTLLRGSDSVLRYSVDASAVQVLYLPVPTQVKLRTKAFIDTVVWKFGDGLAGLALLVLATALGFSPRQISALTLVLIAGWVAAAIIARRRYVATLRANIQQASLKPEPASVPALDQFTARIFAERLQSTNPSDVLYALTLFDVGQQLTSQGLIRPLLHHRSPAVRQRAIAMLCAAGDRSVAADVAELLTDDILDVRTEALRYLIRHDRLDPLKRVEHLEDFADTTIRSATIVVLARPGEGQNIDAARMILERMVHEPGDAGRAARLEAAQLMALLPADFDAQLAALLADDDTEVRTEALRTAGQLRRLQFVPVLIAHLGDERFADEAAAALARLGDEAAEALRLRLQDDGVPIALRREVPAVLLRIGTPAAVQVLADNLLQADLVLRSRIISALNKLYERRRDLILDRGLVETSMIAELMGHYRSYQILGARGGGEPDADLRASMTDEMERIFRLLKLLYPSIDLQAAYVGVQSVDPLTHANALEFLDNTLTPRLRSLLVPLVDSDVTVDERIRLADRFLGFSVPEVSDARMPD